MLLLPEEEPELLLELFVLEPDGSLSEPELRLELLVLKLLRWEPDGSLIELPEFVDSVLVRLMSRVLVELLRLAPAGSFTSLLRSRQPTRAAIATAHVRMISFFIIGLPFVGRLFASPKHVPQIEA